LTPSSAASGSAVLRFLGGTGTVTGSRFLLDAEGARVLLDCGLFQGARVLRRRNWEPFPVDPASIDAVLLTHAHVDHSGFLPGLVRAGFEGPVFATRRTVELCGILLPDAARLQEEDAAYANRRRYSKHRPALPLFSEQDAAAALARLRPVDHEVPVAVARGVRAEFQHAGHILGSASIHVSLEDSRSCSLLASGDLGRPSHPLLLPPSAPPTADALLVESTYGDRVHPEAGAVERLADAVTRTAERGGVVVIPAFAVDRTEVVLFHLRELMLAGRVPKLRVYVDSPMALAALEVYRRAVREGDAEIRPELHGREQLFDPGDLVEARDTQASRAINEVHEPAIVVSASGMATGGRVLHHLARRLPDRRNSVVLVGYQPEGTRGRSLLRGEHAVKMLGRYVPVRAEIVDCSGLSVHADRDEILAWMRQMEAPPEVSYVVHGEPDASSALARAVEGELGWTAVVPQHLESVRLERAAAG
jgi:metallo-beta-lactamase family protein